MDYKKIFKSRKVRKKILNFLEFVPDSVMLKLQYRIKTGRNLDLKNPKRFTEKLQWYKINYRNDLLHLCVDKYEVRDYIKKCGLENILNGCYGVYNTYDEIDFDSLPNSFVIKKTNGGGGLNVIICKDKSKFDFDKAKENITEWEGDDKDSGGREWSYYGLKSRIVIDEYLENPENPEAGIADYKFFCFNGKVHSLVVDVDRYIDHKRNFYDAEWNYLDVSSDHLNFGDSLPKPEKFDEMKKVAEILSKDFPFVRVDLYLVKDKIYFGELTFYPWSGYVNFTPDEFDFVLGEEFILPE